MLRAFFIFSIYRSDFEKTKLFFSISIFRNHEASPGVIFCFKCATALENKVIVLTGNN